MNCEVDGVAKDIVLVNALGAGLAHYRRSLDALLDELGVAVEWLETNEPSASGGGRINWVLRYARLLWRARRSSASIVISTWPVLGYWDFLLVRLIARGKPGYVVLHDPRPLVSAIGYGRLARRIASSRRVVSRGVVHSAAAKQDVENDARLADLVLAPLPMLSPKRSASDKKPGRVLVVGQFKPDRDIDALERISRDGSKQWTYEIVGRRWPTVSGWQVKSEFVAEDEFDRLIASAAAVVIPYKRFYQSDVAVRALELGVAVVGPRDSSLSDFLGSTSGWLVDGDDWLGALARAVDSPADDVLATATSVRESIVAQWREALRSLRLAR